MKIIRLPGAPAGGAPIVSMDLSRFEPKARQLPAVPVEAWQQFADLIKRERKAQKINQREMARRMGTSHAHYNQLENKPRNLQLSTLENAAKALGYRLLITFERK